MPTNKTGTAFISSFLVHCCCCVSFLGLHLSNQNHLHLLCMFIPYMKFSIELKQYESKTCYNLHVMSKSQRNVYLLLIQEAVVASCDKVYENCLELDCNKAKMFANLINDKVHTLTLPCSQFWWILTRVA